jgi:hypothetical protein
MTTQTPSVAAILQEMENERKAKEAAVIPMRQKLLLDLTIRGVSTVEIEFSGSGDSGSIDTIIVDYLAKDKPQETNWGSPDSPRIPEDLREALEEFSYALLETSGVDWYNNDGGQGAVKIDMTTVPFSISANIDVNETVSTEAWSMEEAL